MQRSLPLYLEDKTKEKHTWEPAKLMLVSISSCSKTEEIEGVIDKVSPHDESKLS